MELYVQSVKYSVSFLPVGDCLFHKLFRDFMTRLSLNLFAYIGITASKHMGVNFLGKLGITWRARKVWGLCPSGV